MTTADKRKDTYLRRKYGITLRQYHQMYDKQLGVCAICRRPFGGTESTTGLKIRLPQVDHNHKTGKVRGLLCFRCNKFMVGRHTFQTIKPVYEYLKRTEKGK